MIYSQDETLSTESPSISDVYSSGDFTDLTQDDDEETCNTLKNYDDTLRSRENDYDTDLSSEDGYDTDKTGQTQYYDSFHDRQILAPGISHSKKDFTHSRGNSPHPTASSAHSRSNSAHLRENSAHSRHSGVPMRENKAHSRENGANSRGRSPASTPQKEPLTSTTRHNSLAIGKTPKRSNKAGGFEPQEGKKRMQLNSFHQEKTPNIPAQVSVLTENSSSLEAQMSRSTDNQSSGKSMSGDELYQRLVVGMCRAATETQEQQKPVSQTQSFQSDESNTSRQVVYQASSGANRWESSLPSNVKEEDEEEDKDKDEEKPETPMEKKDDAIPKRCSGSPTVKVDGMTSMKSKMNNLSMGQIVPLHSFPSTKQSVKNASCAAEGMEKDLFSMIESLGIILLGCGAEEFEEDEESQEESEEDEPTDLEEDLSLTRMSADLRKQRLRSQVLMLERDNVTNENTKLRAEIKERDAEVADLKVQVTRLEEEKESALEERKTKDMNLAEMMNDLI